MFPKPRIAEFEYQLPRMPSASDLPEVGNVDDVYDKPEVPVAPKPPEAPKRRRLYFIGRGR